MKNLQKTKKNHERLASALRENLKKRKSRARFSAEKQHSDPPTEAPENIHSNSHAEASEISGN